MISASAIASSCWSPRSSSSFRLCGSNVFAALVLPPIPRPRDVSRVDDPIPCPFYDVRQQRCTVQSWLVLLRSQVCRSAAQWAWLQGQTA